MNNRMNNPNHIYPVITITKTGIAEIEFNNTHRITVDELQAFFWMQTFKKVMMMLDGEDGSRVGTVLVMTTEEVEKVPDV